MSKPSPTPALAVRHPARSLTARALLEVVGFYRRWLSPLKRRPSCRYLPTCSEYAAQAIFAHGAARGTALAAARVLRCNPLFHGGYHPVPSVHAMMCAPVPATIVVISLPGKLVGSPTSLPTATHEGSCCHG